MNEEGAWALFIANVSILGIFQLLRIFIQLRLDRTAKNDIKRMIKRDRI